MSKKIMIVGPYEDQYPALVKSKNLGLKIIAVVEPAYVEKAKAFADKVVAIKFEAEEEILKLAIEEQIDGVITIQSDAAVRAVGRIVDTLHLPGIGYAQSTICTDKSLMKKVWMDQGVHTPFQKKGDSLYALKNDIQEMLFPLIVKPADSSGSFGVTKIDRMEDFEQAFHKAKEFSACGIVCVEQFVAGEEFGIQVFLLEGKIASIFLHNDTVINFIPVGHSLPAQIPVSDEILSLVASAAAAIGIQNGPLNLDLIMSETGPQMIELGARMGATCLPELIEIHAGIDWVTQSIHLALGEPVDLQPKKAGVPCAARNIDVPDAGILASYFLDAKYLDASILLFDIHKNIGDKVLPKPNRIGQIIAEGDSWQEAEKKVNDLYARIVFQIKKEE